MNDHRAKKKKGLRQESMSLGFLIQNSCGLADHESKLSLIEN